LILVERLWFDPVAEHTLFAMATGIYVGIPVGTFLAYFYKDDREIEAHAAELGTDVDYGRDAHWLDPFAYGAVCYLVVFLPQTLELAVCSTAVGSIVGVVAAGVSHFVLSRWNNAVWTIPVAIVGGAVAGLVSGLLFRNYQELLWLPHLAVGCLAGMLTFAATSVVGRRLGLQEQDAQTNSQDTGATS
jgi:purine-cytosine permease-like protein